jgi:predicted ATPase/DNA-binding XRE family transcriptional regulator
MATRDTSFAHLLRNLRRVHGLSQQALAERAGLSTDTIRALERGRHAAPHVSTLSLLADALGLSPDDRAALFSAASPERAAGTITPVPIPRPPDPLIGRERELAEIAALVAGSDTRLVTLLGPGGVGKTRLALEVLAAEDTRGTFVDLAAIRDPALVPTTIAHAAGVRDTGQRDPWQRLLEALGERPHLIVLDNFEQIVAAAPTVSELLAAAPQARVLITSRTPLRLSGERCYPVAPLASIPGADGVAGAAPRLFIARARAVDPHFAPDAATMPAIAAICARLDGLPLAIELAAARIRFLPPAALLDRLDTRLTLLTGGARDMPGRHQTMRAAIDWSYGLLAPAEQAIFRQLAIFRGGCTIDAAITICTVHDGQGDQTPGAIRNGLASLLDMSLVLAPLAQTGDPRIDMFETVHEYAAERLAVSGDASALQAAHARYFLALAERADARFAMTDQPAEFVRLERDHDNLRAALSWCVETNPATGVRLAAALWQFWWAHGHLSEGREWLERVLGAAPSPLATSSPARARALLGAGFLAMQQSDWAPARVHLEAGLALSRDLGDDRLTARLLAELGWLLTYFAEYTEARPVLEEALTISRTLPGDTLILETALLYLARLVRHQGENDYARALLGEALGLAEARSSPRAIAAARVVLGDLDRAEEHLGDAETEYLAALEAAHAAGQTIYIAWAIVGLGQIAMLRDETARARSLMNEGLAHYRELGNTHSIGFVLHMLGVVAFRAGETEEAFPLLRDALRVRWQLGVRGNVAGDLEELAIVTLHLGDATTAARYLAAGAQARAAVGAVASPNEVHAVNDAIATARAALGDGPFAAAWADGESTPLADTVHEALAERVTSGNR